MPTKPKRTNSGTPCARSWTNDWIAAVNAKETELNHRICGARLPDATPCINTSDHPSGRCQFHGGFDLTGAPPGNRNAHIHGLYSRRLRTCTPNCPYYQSCPLSSEALAKEDKPPQSHTSDPTDQSRPSNAKSLQSQDQPSIPHPSSNPQSEIRNPQFPTCPYQLLEYNTVLTDALAIIESQPHPNPMGIHTAHNVAMLQVLVNAGAAQLAQAPNLWSSEDPNPQTPNPSTILAFTRLMREFRHTLKLLHAPGYTPLNRQNSAIHNPQSAIGSPAPDGILRHAQRTQHDTGLDPDSLADAQLEPQTPETHAKAYIQHAALAGGQGHDVEMCEAFDNAALIDEAYAESERDHVLASYRPAKHSVSQELAELILGNLHLPPRPTTHEQNPDTAQPNTGHPTNQESNDVLQHFLDLLREGEMPPEAFPIGSPLRAHAEANYTGPPTGHPDAQSNVPSTATPKPTSETGPATPKPKSEGGSM